LSHATQLKQLLSKGSLVSDNLRDAVVESNAWYRDEPGLPTFILRAILVDRDNAGWTDQQGAPAMDYQCFQNDVLPHLLRIVDTLAANSSAQPMGDIDALIAAYRDFLQSIP
jgi:hypothetical protein